jgi:uncharacterized caspase-like protein
MRALVIGINDYPGHDADLAGCVNDANDIAAMLRARGCEPVMLLDRQATKQAIVTEMISLVTSLTAEQVGFISFSGHGTWVPDRDGDEPIIEHEKTIIRAQPPMPNGRWSSDALSLEDPGG